MAFSNKMLVQPRRIRLEASTVCQLKCPSCPTAAGEIGRKLGNGYLDISMFRHILANNPWISDVELSNWGEIFLNKQLIDFLKYAHDHGVGLHVRNGSNLNYVEDDVPEALIKYGLMSLTCSIDGASQETYSIYRVNGSIQNVLNNIRKINVYKTRYGSQFPELIWQFVAFGHNEHEIGKARKMAEDLNMAFTLKLSWGDLYSDTFSLVKNLALIRTESGLGVADRDEYRKKYDMEYVRDCCCGLWGNPQVNYDGRVLGCCINYWGDYGNALSDGLMKCVNSDRMIYAREMLMGKKESADGIPCSECKIYKTMKENGTWIAEEDIKGNYSQIHSSGIININMFGSKLKKQLVRVSSAVERRLRRYRHRSARKGPESPARLASRVYPLRIPLRAGEGERWTPHIIFKGSTVGLQEMTCHASVLVKDHCPHDPHMHEEEELLLLLSGEVEIILPDVRTTDGNLANRLKAGQFVYYPSGFAHSLRTKSEAPANYLMFKWRNDSEKIDSDLAFGVFDMGVTANGQEETGGFLTRCVFDGSTSYLKKLHCHVSALAPGAGYDPHVDPYNVAIVILEGAVVTLDERAMAYDVIYYAAGEPHGMRNPTEAPARYVVFEFHDR